MGIEVEITDSGATGLERRLAQLGQLTIGLHEGAEPYPDGTTVATVGSAHEFGTDTLPQRSWLRGWVDSAGEKIIGDEGQTQIGNVVDGADASAIVDGIGALSVKGIVDRIEGGIYPELDPATLTSSPGRIGGALLNTGHMRDSIDWKPTP